MATSTVDWPRWIESFTESRALTSARVFWAIAQMAPLSLALLTFRPVEMRFWVVVSSVLVVLRFCRAIIAPTLVLMLFVAMVQSPFLRETPPFWWGSAIVFEPPVSDFSKNIVDQINKNRLNGR